MELKRGKKNCSKLYCRNEPDHEFKRGSHSLCEKHYREWRQENPRRCPECARSIVSDGVDVEIASFDRVSGFTLKAKCICGAKFSIDAKTQVVNKAIEVVE